MAKTDFKIVHDLESLSEEQRAQYLREASVYFGLDPNLNALDLIWMSNEGGVGRKLVAYARKGTADILRDIHQISIKSLEQHDGPGYVSFKATGTNDKGRQEIAVGAHDTDGLKGKRLADAIATAQTRALRRLTLQFVGGGLLDETEVNLANNVATDIAVAASTAQLSGSPVVMPPPKVAPSSAPGKDITEKEAAAIPNNHPFVAAPVVNIPQTLPEFTAQQEKLRVDAQAQLAANSIGPVNSEPEPKRRTRRKRNQVDLASPGQAPVPVPEPTQPTRIETTMLQPSVQATPPVITAVGPAQVHVPLQTVPVTVSVAPVPVVQPVSSVAPDKAKEYRERLAKYSQDILPKAGMMPSDGIGGVTMKLRKFAATFSGSNAQGLSEEQWEDLFEFLDGYSAKNGAPALVEYINKAIGVA